MLHILKQQDIDLWEAWIDFDHLHPEYFGVLYVIGDIVTHRKKREPLIGKREKDGANPKVLVLEIRPETEEGYSRIAEAVYAEPIRSIDQYTSIEIYSGDELIASIREIEVLI